MTSIPRLAAGALLLAICFMVSAMDPARAQSAYSDAKLESFVTAAMQVESLVREYDPQIKAAASPQEADRLRSEAKVKMETAIDQTPGITLDEYGQIVVATRKDQALHSRVDTIYRAAKGQ